MQRLVLAIDNQISLTVVDLLEQHYDIAIWAGEAQDEQWVEEALDTGANVFISPDLDIPNLLDRYGSDAKWIDVPQNIGSEKQYDFLLKKLKAIKC